jgi:hypothetical protein
VALVLPPASAGAASEDTRAVVCRDPDGRTRLLADAAPDREGCTAVVLPVALDRVRWAHALPRPAPRDGSSLIVEGSGRGEAFRPATARFEERHPQPSRPPALPLGPNLLPHLPLRPFGAEERVSATRSGDAVEIACRAGSRPAGLILDSSWARFPAGAAYQVRIEWAGDAGFSAALARPGADPEGATPLRDPVTTLAAPDRSRPSQTWPVIVCPPGEARMVLRQVALTPDPAPPRPVARSAWAWRPALWRDTPERLLDEAAHAGLDRLFVAVEIDGGSMRDEEAFRRFVIPARQRGIAIVVVEGDPAMALPAGREAAAVRLEAVLASDHRAPPEARIAGIQYDIEPYALPAFAAEPLPLLRGFAETLDRLASVAGAMPLDVVLPFWLTKRPEAEAIVLPAVRRTAASVTVMAYRTSPEAILTAAEPVLAWGAAAGRPVNVALESGPVEDEASRVYAASDRGPVLVLPLGSGALVVLLDAAASVPGAQAFTLRRESVSPANRVSFLGSHAAMRGAAEVLAVTGLAVVCGSCLSWTIPVKSCFGVTFDFPNP